MQGRLFVLWGREARVRERVAGKRERRGGGTTQGPSNRNLYYYLCTVHICTIYRKKIHVC